MMRSHSRSALIVVAATLAWPALAQQAPGFMPIQGVLIDSQGQPVVGPVDLRVSLYDSEAAAQPLYSESQSVLVEGGRFTFYLGSTASIDLTLFRDHPTLFVGLAAGTDPEMTPRLPLGTAPYAGFAQYAGAAQRVAWSAITGVPAGLDDGDADTLGGLSCSAGQPPRSTGSGWECGAVDGDTLAGLRCDPGQSVEWSGEVWNCAEDDNLTEAQVDQMVANNGYTSASSLATVATSGSYGDLANLPTDLLHGAGTTGYVAMFSAANALGVSNIYNTSWGGIGVNISPATAFDVAGTIRSTNLGGHEGGQIDLTSPRGTNVCSLDVVDYEGNVDRLRIFGAAVSIGDLPLQGAFSEFGDLGVQRDAVVGGSLGVGSNNPAARLDVRGTSSQNTDYVDDGQADVLALSSNNRGGDGAILALGGSWGATGYIKTLARTATAGDVVIGNRRAAAATRMEPGILLDTAGNVGIGTTAPQARLDVNGNVVAGNVVAGSVAASGFSYRAAQARSLFLSGGAFSGSGMDGCFGDTVVFPTYDGAARIRPLDSCALNEHVGIELMHSVLLPTGALVTRFECQYKNTEALATFAMHAYLKRRPLDTMAAGDMAFIDEHSTGPIPLLARRATTTISNPAIDNSANAYYVLIGMGHDRSFSPEFYGCKIDYTVTQP